MSIGHVLNRQLLYEYRIFVYDINNQLIIYNYKSINNSSVNILSMLSSLFLIIGCK